MRHESRITAIVIAKGGLATTRNGRFGRRRSLASAWTTVAGQPRNRSRSCEARTGWSSTAMTRAPAATSGAVSAPDPAPMSSTRSPGRIPASATTKVAQRLSSRCHPHSGRGCPATEHHEVEGSHGRNYMIPAYDTGCSVCDPRCTNTARPPGPDGSMDRDRSSLVVKRGFFRLGGIDSRRPNQEPLAGRG